MGVCEAAGTCETVAISETFEWAVVPLPACPDPIDAVQSGDAGAPVDASDLSLTPVTWPVPIDADQSRPPADRDPCKAPSSSECVRSRRSTI